MWRRTREKVVEGNGVKLCGGGWEQSVQRKMGAKGVEGRKNVMGVGHKVVEGGCR